MNISEGTVSAAVSLLIIGVIVYAWRRWGWAGGLVVALVACVIAGAYADPVRDAINGVTGLIEAPINAVQDIAN